MADYPEDMHHVRGQLATGQALFGGLPKKVAAEAAKIEAAVTTGALSLEGAKAYAYDFSKKVQELHDMSLDHYKKAFPSGKANKEQAIADASAKASAAASELNEKKAQEGTGISKDSNIGPGSRKSSDSTRQ